VDEQILDRPMPAAILSFGPHDATKLNGSQTREMTETKPHVQEQVILVAHSCASDRTWLADLLVSGGYRVEVCDNGRDALRRIGRERFALVLAAVSMPLMDGLEFLRNVREVSPGLPVIALAHDDEMEQVYLRSAGALGAVATYTMPIAPHALLDGVAGAISGFQKALSG
jgi:two-component system, chemotaxis family, chemotaxis protein CheY